MAKNFNPADFESVKTDFALSGKPNAAPAFLVRRAKRRLRREIRAL